MNPDVGRKKKTGKEAGENMRRRQRGNGTKGQPIPPD